MVAISQKTWVAKTGEVKPEWHHIDASGQILGRMANKIAMMLMGKHKPGYTAHVDTGDFVVVTNVGQLVVTGKKNKQKTYQDFSGYPSGRKLRTFDEVIEHNPAKVLRLAVRRMLPKNKLGRKMLGKLKIYEGAEHPHTAQKPQPYKVTYGRKAAQE
ncbi:MAG: 50S ribosomal protein L13 [Planctomycetes bacterium]|nr:50S ribosomal protein L13 [Planctomycetota bacterium]MCW8136857.1 50S ribosomal protein L13 [Planctomycetota bacterium]